MGYVETDPGEDEIFTLAPDHTSDPDGERLRAILDAHLDYERARTARRRWVVALAVGCGLTWFLAIPQLALLPAWAASLGAAVCGAVAVPVGIAGLVEWYRYSRWMRAMTEHGHAAAASSGSA